jgi:hypothetical protein
MSMRHPPETLKRQIGSFSHLTCTSRHTAPHVAPHEEDHCTNPEDSPHTPHSDQTAGALRRAAAGRGHRRGESTGPSQCSSNIIMSCLLGHTV